MHVQVIIRTVTHVFHSLPVLTIISLGGLEVLQGAVEALFQMPSLLDIRVRRMPNGIHEDREVRQELVSPRPKVIVRVGR